MPKFDIIFVSKIITIQVEEIKSFTDNLEKVLSAENIYQTNSRTINIKNA